MTNKIETYSGFIRIRGYSEDSEVVYLDDDEDPLLMRLKDYHETNVAISYYLSDKKITLEEAKLNFASRLFGELDCEFIVHYSDITGFLYIDKNLNIGGHNLLRELEMSSGKYLILVIETK